MEWRAVYTDNTEINDKYADIDRSKLRYFDILNDDNLLLRVDLSGKEGLIYRRRVVMDVNSNNKKVVYIVGYKENGKPVVNHVYENGNVDITDFWKGGNPLPMNGDEKAW